MPATNRAMNHTSACMAWHGFDGKRQADTLYAAS